MQLGSSPSNRSTPLILPSIPPLASPSTPAGYFSLLSLFTTGYLDLEIGIEYHMGVLHIANRDCNSLGDMNERGKSA